MLVLVGMLRTILEQMPERVLERCWHVDVRRFGRVSMSLTVAGANADIPVIGLGHPLRTPRGPRLSRRGSRSFWAHDVEDQVAHRFPGPLGRPEVSGPETVRHG